MFEFDWIFVALCAQMYNCHQSTLGLIVGLLAVVALLAPYPQLIMNPALGDSFIRAHWPITMARPTEDGDDEALDDSSSAMISSTTTEVRMVHARHRLVVIGFGSAWFALLWTFGSFYPKSSMIMFLLSLTGVTWFLDIYSLECKCLDGDCLG